MYSTKPAVAAILLIVSVYFLISYIKDQKKTKLT
ncbi:TPA: small membrane protein, partial [Klebsiella pneumoniae]|nr:small membrane protein [Klebsiella pneumoniae]